MAAPVCSREGCSRPVLARGLCDSDYTTARRRGEFEGLGRPRRAPGLVCPPEHKHGATGTCWKKHRCTCDSCYKSRSAFARQYRLDRFYGRSRSLIPTPGLQRRIQALHAAGWSFRELDRRLGFPRGRTAFLLAEKTVMPATFEKVRAVFAELEVREPPSSTAHERRAITVARQRAAAEGWAPPLAWDDIDADDAPAVSDGPVEIDGVIVQNLVDGHPEPKATYAERREAIAALNGRGLNDSEIAELLGLTRAAVYKVRERAAISAAVGTDRERIVA